MDPVTMMLIGGGISMLPGLMEKLWPGKQEEYKQIPTMTGGQRGLLDQLMASLGGQGQMGGPMGSGMNYLSQLMSGSPEAMQAFEAPAMRQFNEQTVPNLAEQFSKMGSGSQQSSAFAQALGGQAAGLSERLQAMRSGLQSNAMDQMSRLFGYGMSAQPFATGIRGAQGGLGAALGPAMGQIGGQVGQMGMMKGMGLWGNQTNQFQPKTFNPLSDTLGPYGSYTPGQYNWATGMTR